MDPLTLAVGVGTAAVAGVSTGLRLRRRLRQAEATAAGLRHELAEARYAANHDSLTGLPNRRAFYRLGNRLIAETTMTAHGSATGPARSGTPASVACVVVDLNSFKQINDTLGHAAGDEVLVAVARRLAGFGASGDSVVARLGGDEFAGLFASRSTDWALLYPAVDSLAELLAAPMAVAGRQLRVTASVGAAAVTAAGGLATALRHADSAMYRAKATGTRAACFNPVLDDEEAAAAAARGAGIHPSATRRSAPAATRQVGRASVAPHSPPAPIPPTAPPPRQLVEAVAQAGVR